MKQETQLFSMNQLSATVSSPATHTACSLSTTAQPGTPQRRVVILPARGSVSPIKVSTSPKCILSTRDFTSGSGSSMSVPTAYTNCGLVENRCTGAARAAFVSDTVCISSCVSQCIRSTIQGSSSGKSDDGSLSTTLQVDGILTSSSENASRHGIISVACHESRVQETSVLSPVTSVTRLMVPACSDNHSVSSSRNVTVSSSSGNMYQSVSSVSQTSTDKMCGTQVRPANSETSVHHAVALVSRPSVSGSQTVASTRTVNVTSIRKLCPSADVQKRNVVVKLFAENSGSHDAQTTEQCRPADVTCASPVKSPKCVVLLRSIAAENTGGVCLPSVLQQSDENTTTTTACQPCPSLQTVNVVVTSAAKAVSAVLGSTASCHSQKVTEAMKMTLNGSQNNPAVAVATSELSSIQVPTNSASNGDTKSDDDSDDDSVIIIDADMVPLSPSPSFNSTKRSLAAQNVILLNHHKSSSPQDVDSKRLSPKAVVADRTEQSRTKRKSVLGTRLLESGSDECIILPASHGFENSSRISKPNRRKSLPQRRTDTSVPQLQLCTKQWIQHMKSSLSTTALPTCRRSQSRSPKKDAGTDVLEKADRSTILQSNLRSSLNSCDRRKRKTLDQYESSTSQASKRSKRLLPVKSDNTYYNKSMETSDNVVRKDDAVESRVIGTSLSADSTKTSSDGISATGNSSVSHVSASTKTNCQDEVLTTQPAADSELQLLGKDKRSMEMSVTNEDGVVENLLVTIIDISSSDEEEENNDVGIQSVSSAKLESAKVSMPVVETSQSVTSKTLISSAGADLKTLSDQSSCLNSSTLAPDHQPMSKSSCKTKPVRQKCGQIMRSSSMGRKVLVKQRTPPDDEHVDVTKVKPLTQLCVKSNSRKRSKNDAGGTVKITKADSDSVSVGYLGPVVRLHGSKDSPASCSVVSGARDVGDEMAARLKCKHVMLNSSCYPTSFQLQDSVPWKCVFCHQSSSYRTLGDLFGPYYAKTDSYAQSDSVTCHSSPSRSRSHSAKKNQESNYTVVSQKSPRRRQQLQKYAPPVAKKSPQKSLTSPDKGIPPEIWLHEDCAIWTSGISLSPTGQLCGLEAAITLSLQMVHSSCSFI